MKFKLFAFFFVLTLLFVSDVSAQNYGPIQGAWEQMSHTAGGAGFSGTPMDPRLIVANAIKIALTLVATILFALNVYAGYQWMTAGGNDEKVGDAKKTIRNSTIGLIVILAAYGITIAVTNLASGRNLSSGASKGDTLDKALEESLFND